MSLPKVLIIGQPFNNDSGGGITLTNLFYGWEKDKLAVACSVYFITDSLNTEICDNYYQLGSEENKWRYPFRFLQKKHPSGVLDIKKLKTKRQTIKKEGKATRKNLIMNYFYPMLQTLGLSHILARRVITDDFKTWVKKFDPDVIYVQTSGIAGITFCLNVKEFLDKPMVYHVMDDWPSKVSDKGLLKNYWHNKIDKLLRKLLDQSSVLLGISDEMGREYKRRYGKDFVTFHNPIEIDFWKKYQRKDYRLGKSPKVLYAGRTGLGIQSSLITIARAIESVNQQLGLSVQFVLQTAEKPEWTGKFDCVVHKEFVPYEELPKEFAEADFLILPYDFSGDSIRFIQYSMPTKAPEYMASGTPVLVFAPEVTATVKYARQYNWAKVITENKVESLAEGFRTLLLNGELRKNIAQNAIQLAESRHGTVKVRNDFKNVICSLYR